MKFATAILLTMSAEQVHAWWNNGHMITARIAYDVLRNKYPDALSKAETVLKTLSPFTSHELNHAFVESAIFPDDLKTVGF